MTGSKLYVGNLSYSVTEDQLVELFAEYGDINYVKVIEGKGFGFVELSTPELAEKAMNELNGKDFKGRALRIDEARPKTNNKPKREFRRF